MGKKNSAKTFALMIIFGLVFLILGSFLGFYFGTKMANINNNTSKDNVSVSEEEKGNGEVSGELLVDLEKKAKLASWYAVDIMYDDVMFNTGLSNIFGENNQDIYYEVAASITYRYYLYKTGAEAESWTTEDITYGPCFEQSQNGYCYVIDKEEILKYDKTMFNIGEKMLGTFDGYALLKNGKYYITDIPYGPASLEVSEGETVSSTMNEDKSIDLVVKYSIESRYTGMDAYKEVNYRYTFKLNQDNEYFLYSVYEVK